jgi:hypothetical protein
VNRTNDVARSKDAVREPKPLGVVDRLGYAVNSGLPFSLPLLPGPRWALTQSREASDPNTVEIMRALIVV